MFFARPVADYTAALLPMKEVNQYNHVKRLRTIKGKPSKLVNMIPLQAASLCVEKLHRLCKDQKSWNTVTETDASTLDLIAEPGQMSILIGSTFRPCLACTLVLQPPEAKLAVKLLEKQRAFFGDLRFNIFHVTKPGPPGLGVEFDLLGDVGPTSGLANWVHGSLWVELKVFSAMTFSKSMKIEEKKLEKKFSDVQRRDKSIGAVLLLAAKVQKDAPSLWTVAALTGRLWNGEDWHDVSPSGVKNTKGRVNPADKKPLAQVWADMDWFPNPLGGRARVGKLVEFLSAMSLKDGNPGKRAKVFNKRLEKGGFSEDVKLQELALGLPGDDPWCGTKKCFRALYDYCV